MGIGIGSQFIKDQSDCSPRVSVETCGHYLLLNKEQRLGALGKVNPPLREQAQVEGLWDRIRDGTIDFLGSDHVPHTRASKGDDLWSAMPGLPGITMSLPILLSEGVHKRHLPLTKVVELTSYRAARVFHLYPKKGALEIGSDADIVIVDLEKRVEITPEVLNSVSDYTPYQGYICHGWPHLTICRGRVSYRNGQIVNK
jgi:dihydropyrimidinase